MPQVYVAKPPVVPEVFYPPGWNPIWPWEDENSVEPPGYDPGSPILFAHNPDDPIPPTYRVVYRVGMNSDYGGIQGAIIRQQGAHAFPLQINYAEELAPAAKARIDVSWDYWPEAPREEHGVQTSSSDGFECGVSQTEDYAFEMTVSELADGYSYVFTSKCSKYDGSAPYQTYEWVEEFFWNWDTLEWDGGWDVTHHTYLIDPPTWTVTIYRTTYRIVYDEVVGQEAWLFGAEITPPTASENPNAPNYVGTILGYDEEERRFTSLPWLGIMKTGLGLSVLGQQYTGGNQYAYRRIPYRTLDFTY